jgi:hypothetical protein
MVPEMDGVTPRVTDGDERTVTVKAPELLAIGLVKDAAAYVDSARQLDKSVGGAARFIHPVYFLLCQAIELALKGYLAASGVPHKTLRDEIRHDLEKALQRAQDFGFNAVDARFPELVRWLAPFHLDHSFRYRKTGFIQPPVASEAAEIIGNTIGPIEQYVRSQFMKMRSRAHRL